MKFKVELTPQFKKEAKKLSRKYASLKGELSQLFETLENTPETGTRIGENIYKIRLAIASKGKGKSGGARIVTYILVSEHTVLLLTIYNKSERNNLTEKEIQQMLKDALS